MSSVQLPLEMRASANSKLKLLLGWLFLMVASAYTVSAGGIALAVVGWFGLAFFGYAGLKLFRQRSGLAGLVLTTEGVRATGWNTAIPWSEITDIGVGTYKRNKLVGFNVANYDRLLAEMSPGQLREMKVLRQSLKPLSLAILAADEDVGELPELASGHLQDTLAACRRIVGWDVVAMQIYLDRPVEEAAQVLEAVRRQQAATPPEIA